MIRTIVCGLGGQMGQRLANLIFQSEDLELVGATERPGSPLLGRDIGEACGRLATGRKVSADLASIVAGAQVVIDFTAPEATLANGPVCAAAGVAMVVGTTGMKPEQVATFQRAVQPVACVMAPNYSTAMNVLFKLVEEAARILGDDYDVELTEMHHHLKVDAPSGSALRLAEAAARGLDRNLAEVAVYGRQGQVGKRTKKEIGIHAIRAGDIAGDHTVLFGTPGEYIELRHHATSRDAFARGALRAARFAVQAGAGLYDMGDVLGIK
ncbi:MAG: 4-hydroxy-tetrahydrodipicolinate reductase [Candidatus Latescibacteria bacterium]|nr:4-hydroxy-tetrahydrodipicolinate reductase [Candidatus Latescibacterota bacterium]